MGDRAVLASAPALRREERFAGTSGMDGSWFPACEVPRLREELRARTIRVDVWGLMARPSPFPANSFFGMARFLE